MSYFDAETSREIILDHVNNPKNINKKHDNYLSRELKNPSCGDKVIVYALIEENIIKDITYEVEGCSVCKASVSMVSDMFINKNISEIDKFGIELNKMINEENFDEFILKDMVSLQTISRIPARIKCATLGYKALKDIVEVM